MRRRIVITGVTCIAVAALLSACSSSSKSSDRGDHDDRAARGGRHDDHAHERDVAGGHERQTRQADHRGLRRTDRVHVRARRFQHDIKSAGRAQNGLAAGRGHRNRDCRLGLTAAKLAAHPQAGGSLQVAYGGHLLYTFANDKAPGDATGQGLGGIWYTVTPAGAKNT